MEQSNLLISLVIIIPIMKCVLIQLFIYKILNGAAQLLVTTVHYIFTLTYFPFFLCSHPYVAIVAAAQPQSNYGNCLIVKAAAPADSRLKKKNAQSKMLLILLQLNTNKQTKRFIFIHIFLKYF